MAEIDLSKDASASENDRVKVEAEQICPACEHMLWVSFYFDGFGFSDKDGPQTNIVKLFNATYDIRERNMRKFYYPGLGAPYDPETSTLIAALGDKAKDKLEDSAKDKAKEAKEAVVDKTKESASDAWKESAKIPDPTLMGRVDSTVGKVLTDAKKVAEKKAKGAWHAMSHPGGSTKTAYRFLRREWWSYVRDVRRYPFRAAKAALVELAKVTVGYVAESMGFTRDSKLGAALFNTGVDTRLKAAEEDFLAAVIGAKRSSTIHKIHVGIFGYDMGGGLAVAFSQRLLDEVCKGGKHEGIPVKIKFMGLFDCVTNRFDENLLTGFIPLSNAISSDLKLSPEIEKCVHYAAAHELRLYKQLTMLGVDPADMRGPRQERLFPGAQTDVGGGAPDGEDGISDKLARVPLEMMYYRAYGAGVPMPDLDALKGNNARLYAEIIAPPDIEDFQLNYRLAVKKLVTTTREIPNLPGLRPADFGFGPKPPQRSLGPLDFLNPQPSASNPIPEDCRVPSEAAPPRPIMVTDVPKDIEGEVKGHMVVYIQWLRMWYDQPRNREAAEQRKGGWLSDPANPLAYGRYNKLAKEIDFASKHIVRTNAQFDEQQAMKQLDGRAPADMFNDDPQGQALYWLWCNPGKRLPDVESMYPLFIKHVHDSMAECDIETAYSDLVAVKNYLNIRSMQKISTEPDKSFLERVSWVYHKLVPPDPKPSTTTVPPYTGLG